MRDQVRSGYSQIAKQGGSCCGSQPGCGGSSPAAAEELPSHIGHLPTNAKPSDYIVSLEVTALKPVLHRRIAVLSLPMDVPKLEIYDPPMCCSTGVCGPSVDPKLIQFAADLKWLETQGVQIARFNLSQNPAAFVENQQVNNALAEQGESALPMILIKNRVIASGEYPNRSQLLAATIGTKLRDSEAASDPRCGDASSKGKAAGKCCG